MKTPYIKQISLCAVALTLSLSGLNAATTEPVGYVTVTVNANADTRVGVPLTQAPTLSATVSSVASGTVTITSTVPDVTTDAHYLWVTSGTLLGKWYEVTGSAASTVVVNEDLQTAGLAANDTFKVVPFWTLNTLFPSGGDLPLTSNPASPSSLVMLNDVTTEGTNLAPVDFYFYHDGSVGPEGWYLNGNPGAGLQNNVVISPETYISLRNSTGSLISVAIAGKVPTESIAIDIVQRAAGVQDNQIPNPFPTGMTLTESDLISSGVFAVSPNPASPTDLLLVFESLPTAKNPAPDKAFFYHDGSVGPEGWFQNGNPGAGLQGSYELSAGGAIIIRKGGGSDTVLSWSPTTPYSL